MTKLLLVAAALMLLGGCSNRANQTLRTYDFGLASDANRPAINVDIRPVESPEWLDRPEMLYRLAYRDPNVLEPYAMSRWAGTPAAMLTLKLRQTLGGADPRSAGCVLTVYLEEFSQVFDSEEASRAVLYARAHLREAGPRRRNESTALRLEDATPTPDAAGGAKTFSELAEEFTRRLGDWVWASGYCGQPAG
jgi:cholesterol transport system auxiliary component